MIDKIARLFIGEDFIYIYIHKFSFVLITRLIPDERCISHYLRIVSNIGEM